MRQDTTTEAFYNWVTHTFPPIGLVFSSSKAKSILSKNNLTPSQFMRPFGDLKDINLLFCLNEKYQNVVRNYFIDFYDPIDFKKIDQMVFNNYIVNCLNNERMRQDINQNYNKLTKKNIIDSLNIILKDYSLPYYLEFEKLYFELCRFQETELYQQPLIYIYICDVDDEETIIFDMKREQMPKLISSGVFDSEVCELIILLNNKRSSKIKKFNKVIVENKFKNTYYNISLLTIDVNTNIDNNSKIQMKDIWTNYIHKIEFYSEGYIPTERGIYFGNQDIENFKLNFSEFIKERFRTFIVDKIIKLDKNLSKSGGISNIFSKFKGNNKQEKTEYIREYSIMKLNSNDRQRFLLSLLLFHVHDYMDAYTNLKKLKDSINKKSCDYDTSVKQFLYICRYLKKEEKIKIDTTVPYNFYIENRQYILAYRALLIHIKMTEQLKPKDMIDTIYRIIPNMTKRYIKYINALVLEKIGFFYLLIDNQQPKLRKFAMNILNYSSQAFAQENEIDIRNYFLINNFSFIFDTFKVLTDYSKYDNDMELNTYTSIKKYIYSNLCMACNESNNIKLGLYCYINYLRLLLYDVKEVVMPSQKKSNSFDFLKEEKENMSLLFEKFTELIKNTKTQNIDNFPIPIIDDDSLSFFTEQDQKILYENKVPLTFLDYFKKYTELSVEQKYSVLSEKDISCMRFLDEQSSKKFISNYFMKSNTLINVGEQIFVRFDLLNPLNIELPINYLTLIIENKNKSNNENINTGIDCSQYNVNLPNKTMHHITLKLVINEPGIYEVKGVSMTLFNNINVSYYFGKKTINTLYLNQIIKNNKNKLLDDLMSKNVKTNFIFNTIESNKAITIDINNKNNKINLYQNQIEFIPIKIMNNNNDIEIRKFTIFFGNNNNILCPKYLHQNYFSQEINLLVPIVGVKRGECKLLIIIKFEEKASKNILELYRNVLTVNIMKGANLNMSDDIYEYTEKCLRKLINLNMNVKDKNIKSIKINKNKSFIINKNLFYIENHNEEERNVIINSKNINEKLIIKMYLNKNDNDFNQEQLSELLSENEYLKQDKFNYGHISNFFKNKFCKGKNIILKYKLNIVDNEQNIKEINCIYKHEINNKQIDNMKNYYIDNSSLREKLKDHFKIKFDFENLDDNQKYFSIHLIMFNFDESFFNFINIIEYIEVKINEDNNNFEWIGLSITRFNLPEKIDDNEKVKTFNYVIDANSKTLSDKKGAINLNQFIFYVKIKNSNNINQYIDFPYAIYYKKE